jgi:hypothetical protein
MRNVISFFLLFCLSSSSFSQTGLTSLVKSDKRKMYKPDNQITFSHKAGFYLFPFYQKIYSLLGDTIYYTLNGDFPTESSNIYTDSILMDYKFSEPNFFSEIPTTPEQNLISYKAWTSPNITIDKATIIRCASYRNGIRTSNVYTKSFFIDDKMFEKYTLPIISLITATENLFSYDSGIYVPGVHFNQNDPEWTGNYFQKGEGWERPVHVEYFETNGSLGFSQNAGIRIHGLKTRQAAQKSLRLYAREEYEEKYFNYQLMPQKSNKQYKRFLLRTSMAAWNGQTIIADVLAQDIARNLNIEYQDYQPVIVYINGEYWGIHTIRDRIDERYVAYTYDIDKDSIDLISGNNTVISGSNIDYINLLAFIESNDLSFSNNYEYIKTQIDIDNYIDYQISEIFFKNYDWPANNMKLWKYVSNSKWRWILYDLDAGFKDESYNMLIHATETNPNITWPNSSSSTFLFRNLLKNSMFCSHFLSRYAEILNFDFSVQNMTYKLNKMKDLYAPEVYNHSTRWDFPDNFYKWEEDIDSTLLFFIKNRPCSVIPNILEFFNTNDFSFICEINANSESELILAPNPNNGVFFIYNNTSDITNTTINIVNVHGQNVLRQDCSALINNEYKYFNLSHLSSGVYFLTVGNYRQKIIKLR